MVLGHLSGDNVEEKAGRVLLYARLYNTKAVVRKAETWLVSSSYHARSAGLRLSCASQSLALHICIKGLLDTAWMLIIIIYLTFIKCIDSQVLHLVVFLPGSPFHSRPLCNAVNPLEQMRESAHLLIGITTT